MINNLKKTINDPLYALHVLKQRYLKRPNRNIVFAHKKEFRSDSENGQYAATIVRTLVNQKSFENFKREPAYRAILEHVSKKQGEDYLRIIQSRKDGLFEKSLNTICRDDEIGNPIKYSYDGVEIPLSPTTLRYLKVASDLNGLFGKELGNVAEIGCGYGGQALTNDQVLEVNLATLFDLPFVNELIERYLNSMLMNGAYKTTFINQETPNDYDLVISNYAFSELPSVLQDTYLDKVLSRSKRGYLTMNSGLGGDRSIGKQSLAQLREKLPKFEVYEEEPITSQHNYIIVWGHNGEFASDNLVEKKV